jgi:hypothetical protein
VRLLPLLPLFLLLLLLLLLQVLLLHFRQSKAVKLVDVEEERSLRDVVVNALCVKELKFLKTI